MGEANPAKGVLGREVLPEAQVNRRIQGSVARTKGRKQGKKDGRNQNATLLLKCTAICS